MLLCRQGPLPTKIQNHRLEYFCPMTLARGELARQKFPMPFAISRAGCSKSFFAEAIR